MTLNENTKILQTFSKSFVKYAPGLQSHTKFFTDWQHQTEKFSLLIN